jgi:hypothetical protein
MYIGNHTVVYGSLLVVDGWGNVSWPFGSEYDEFHGFCPFNMSII